MATVKISPITTQTTGGYKADITGIDPTDHDCLSGTIDTPGSSTIDAKWNLGGICRDNDSSCNLDTHRSEVADAVETAKKLGAPG